MSKPDLTFIMERVGTGNTAADFVLFGCRGESKGCSRNKYRNSKVHCADCIEADPNETLEQFKTRLERGDA